MACLSNVQWGQEGLLTQDMMLLIVAFVSLILGIVEAATIPQQVPGLILNGRPLLSTNETILPSDLNDTSRFTIPDTTMSLFLTPYGDRLTQQDIILCLQDASSFIIRQITLRGNRPMLPRTWRVNNAQLEAHPGFYMTLIRGLEVVGALEEIVVDKDWTFATQVLIMDAHLGRIGSLNIAYWAAPRVGMEDAPKGRREWWGGRRKGLDS